MLRVIDYLFYLFIFLIPWQARFILLVGELNGGFWEYGTVAFYAVDVLFALIVVLSIIWFAQQKKSATISNQIKNSNISNIHSKLLLSFVAVYIFLSIFWSLDKPVALYAALKLFEGIALFFLIRILPINREKLVWAFVASALVQSVLAIAQFFMQSVFTWPLSGIAPQDPSDLGVSVVQFGEERWLRAYGSFPHPNILGAFLAIALLFMTWQIVKIKSKKILFASSYVLVASSLFFTFSRAAWLAFFVGLVIYAVQTKAWKEKIFLQLTLLLVVIVSVLTAMFFPLVRTRVAGGSRLEIQSNQERTTGYREAIQLIKAHPLIGVGIGNYTSAVARELRPNDPAWSYQPAHNIFLLILSELGLIGFIFLLGFLWQTKKFILHNSYFIIPLFILSLFDHSLWTLHSGVLLLFFILTVARNHPSITPYGK